MPQKWDPCYLSSTWFEDLGRSLLYAVQMQINKCINHIKWGIIGKVNIWSERYSFWKVRAFCLKFWGQMSSARKLDFYIVGSQTDNGDKLPWSRKHLISRPHVHLQQALIFKETRGFLSHFLLCFPFPWNPHNCEEGRKHCLI